MTSTVTLISLGNTVLRLVNEDDATFIWRLRTDPALSRHLSHVQGDVDAQREWIHTYKAREAAGHEYYFVILNSATGIPCGTIRIYNITQDAFTWGSFILTDEKPRLAAVTALCAVMDFGFEKLGKLRSVFDVRKENDHAIAFYRRFGATETGSDDLNLYFKIFRDDYTVIRQTVMSKLIESHG